MLILETQPLRDTRGRRTFYNEVYQYAFDEVYVFDGTTPYNAGVNYKREYNRPKKIEASQAFAKAILDLKDPKYGFKLYQYAFDEVYVFDGTTPYNAGVNYKREYNRPKKIEASQAFAKAILDLKDPKYGFKLYQYAFDEVYVFDGTTPYNAGVNYQRGI